MEGELSFGALNYAVLAVYLAFMVWIGIRLAGKQETTKDFFLAGQTMPWIAVAMSVFATITSAITYMGVPGLVYSENMSIYVGILMMPVAAPFIILLFLPFYRKLEVTTSYEYIDRRFGLPARYCVSSLFLLARLGWLGTVIYAPALALAVVTGIPLWLAIVLIGVLATVYTVMGGLAAVIWTDVAQFLILAGGALLVAVSLLNGVPGGLSEILRVASESGRLNFGEWRLSLTQMTITAVAVSYLLQFMHDYGVDQLTVQRLMASKTYSGMVWATVLNALFSVVIIGVLAFIGLGLYAYHQAWPDRLPDGLAGDRIFPYYVVHALPSGISGLVISGIFAAAMSSLDSGINSMSTVVVNDILKPLRKTAVSEDKDVTTARVLTLVFGGFATVVAFFASRIGNIIETAQVFLGLFSGPVLALFLLGILTRRGSFAGWLIGVAVGLPATIWIQKETSVHFIYYFPFSFAVSLIASLAASAVLRSKAAPLELTVWGMNRSEQSTR
ncbi:MAG: sodium/solute symporter [Candidatus Hydrogenedentes bacterium]|nr:sodium/solute symporter [Candidatus Hydrogenedentota bacterium]